MNGDAAPDPEPEVLVEIAGPVATVTLNRPRQGNSITGPMMLALMRAFQRLNDAKECPDVRVIVLTGKGKFFCTGMDLRGGGLDLAKMKPYTPFDVIWRSPKPVVVAMNGPALGGGVGILFAGDIRVATTECFIQFSEVKIGIYPAMISAYITPQLGASLTRQLMLTAEKFPASELLATRTVAAVVPPAELWDAVGAVVAKLLRNSLEAQAGVKRLMELVAYGGTDGHEDTMGELTVEFGRMMRSREAKAGGAYFREHRKPMDWNEYYEAQRAARAGGSSKL